jgi:L-iditol 2-dehydrogenase
VNAGEIPDPVPGPGEVLFRPLRIGLRIDPEKGGVASHGIAGEVVQVGSSVENVQPGEHYSVQSIVGCGECEHCYASRENLCSRPYHTHGFGEAGVFAELFVLPPAALQMGCLIQLPEGIAPDSGLFVEPLAFCINGLNHIPINRSVQVVIIGAGLTGILCGIIARYRNARRVTVCDPDQKRIEILRGLDLPFDDIIAGGDEAVSRIHAESPGGVEATVCALPDPAALRRSFGMAAIGGHISFMVPSATAASGASVDPAAITRRELHIHGASGANRGDSIEARHMIAEGVVPAAQLISRRFPIQDLKGAIEYLSDPASRPLAVSLEVQGATVRSPERLPERAAEPAPRPSIEPASRPEAEPEGPAPAAEPEPQDWTLGLSDHEISEMARRVREPKFDYGPGSDLGPSGELSPWPELPPDFKRDRDRKRRPDRGRRGRGEARMPPRPLPHGDSRRSGHPQPGPAGSDARQDQGRRRRRGGRGRGRRDGRPLSPDRQAHPAPRETGPIEGMSRHPLPPSSWEPAHPPAEPIHSGAMPEPPAEPRFPRLPPMPEEVRPPETAARVDEEIRSESAPAPAPSPEIAPPVEEPKPAATPARAPREGPARKPRPAARSTPSSRSRSRPKSAPKEEKGHEKGAERKASRPAAQRGRSTRPAKAKGSDEPGGGSRRDPAKPARAPRSSPGRGSSGGAPRGEPPPARREGTEKDPLSSWPDFWEEK